MREQDTPRVVRRRRCYVPATRSNPACMACDRLGRRHRDRLLSSTTAVREIRCGPEAARCTATGSCDTVAGIHAAGLTIMARHT